MTVARASNTQLSRKRKRINVLILLALPAVGPVGGSVEHFSASEMMLVALFPCQPLEICTRLLG